MKQYCSLVIIQFVVLIVLPFSIEGYDPSQLQDLCVAAHDSKPSVYVNGEVCKDPANTTADDFYTEGFHIPADTSSRIGFNSTLLTTDEIPGLNNGGVTVSRLDFAPKGVNPPHHHPRATEILFVLKGKILAGFVTSNPEHRQFTKIMKPGDVFVIPLSLVHFQFNMGKTKAQAFSAFSSQNPGVQTEANSLFDADPPINPEMLAKAFQLKTTTIKELQRKPNWVNP